MAKRRNKAKGWADRIRQEIDRQQTATGMTYQDLEDRSGVARETISRFHRGKRAQIRLENVEKLANALAFSLVGPGNETTA